MESGKRVQRVTVVVLLRDHKKASVHPEHIVGGMTNAWFAPFVGSVRDMGVLASRPFDPIGILGSEFPLRSLPLILCLLIC